MIGHQELLHPESQLWYESVPMGGQHAAKLGTGQERLHLRSLQAAEQASLCSVEVQWPLVARTILMMQGIDCMQGVKSKLRLKGFHRRTSSEPTPIESWQRHVQQFPS